MKKLTGVALFLIACFVASSSVLAVEPLQGEWSLDAKQTLKEVEQYLTKQKFVAGQIKQILDHYKAEIIPNMTMEVKKVPSLLPPKKEQSLTRTKF
ncbi:MAG: hypothetical protein ACKVH8_20450 [Pirellulales bacterium]